MSLRRWMQRWTSMQGAGAGAAPASNLFSDTFTDADDTLLTAHTPDEDSVGGGWSATANIFLTPSALKIVSNAATGAVSAGTDIGGAVVDVGNADVVIEADVHVIAANGVGGSGLLFRYQDATHQWRLDFLAGSPGTIRLMHVTGITITVIDSVSKTITNDTTYSVVITLSGNSILVETDGETLSTTDARYATETKHGISVVDNGTVISSVDNIVINPT